MDMAGKINLLIFSFLCFFSVYGQYDISVTIHGIGNRDIYLAYYFGDKNYVVDTARLDNQGRGIFSGNKSLDEGIYLVVLPSRAYFDIIIDQNQRFSVETDTSSDIRKLVDKLRIKGSPTNTQFRDYQKFMFEKTKEAHILKVTTHDNTANEKKRQKASSDLEKLNKEIREMQQKIIRENPSSLLAKVIKAFDDPEVPQIGEFINGIKVDSLFQYNYYKDHYFDNVDFNDVRLLKSPIYHSRLVRFFDQVVSPIPDSVIHAAEKLLNKADASQQFLQYTLQHVFNKYSQSKIMGHDKVTVYIADNYYLNGKSPWADEAFLKKLEERIVKMRPNIIGADAPRLDKAQTPDGAFYPLHAMRGKLIAVVFWEPSCGHCKKEMPQLLELFHKYHQKGFHVYAFYTQNNVEEWKTTIEKLSMDSFVNVYDPFYFTRFRDTYDVYSTPTLYLLDENFKIMAKRISLEILEDIIKETLKD
jgi:thiol-disulfide isomerase/thioredoxin